MGPSFNIVVVFVVVFFAQMFDLSQLLVRFYNRETLLRLIDGTRTVLYILCSPSALSWKRERDGGAYSRGEGTQEECFCQERR